jgi:hypothetical protein
MWRDGTTGLWSSLAQGLTHPSPSHEWQGQGQTQIAQVITACSDILPNDIHDTSFHLPPLHHGQFSYDTASLRNQVFQQNKIMSENLRSKGGAVHGKHSSYISSICSMSIDIIILHYIAQHHHDTK